ncbi:hypothetical protein CYMTET_15268 [Cymbomonas tetramitiformis]|uniref:Translation initiation factor eIF2B subunit alpha n=1 Tax=Cymbomonas tetramitiformis TaxID=36881 RepID=A0AAE0GEX8_9CHLO|nr:hypothetical protein CYMTET_15268 [Cymbomonas tetramitiformis]
MIRQSISGLLANPENEDRTAGEQCIIPEDSSQLFVGTFSADNSPPSVEDMDEAMSRDSSSGFRNVSFAPAPSQLAPGHVAAESLATEGRISGEDVVTGAVVREFHAGLNSDGDMAISVAVIKALTFVIKNSKAYTIMELEKELKAATDALRACLESHQTSISLSAGCELFMRYVTKALTMENSDLDESKRRLTERGDKFAETSHQAKTKIAELGQRYVRDGGVILLHGFSRVALGILKQAATQGKNFSVMVTEGRPDNSGQKLATLLRELGLPVTLVIDSAAAYVMDRVDMVLVGAEGVVENGGIINKIGTYQLAMVAKALGTPFYCAAESYKFARLYPLNQRDLPKDARVYDLNLSLPQETAVETPSRDYTPPQLITLLFTDLGILTPSAVSDELIQLFL